MAFRPEADADIEAEALEPDNVPGWGCDIAYDFSGPGGALAGYDIHVFNNTRRFSKTFRIDTTVHLDTNAVVEEYMEQTIVEVRRRRAVREATR